MYNFAGKSVVITGGASGIGRATGKLLGGYGARLTFLDIDRQSGEEFCDELNGAGVEVQFVEGDVVSEETVETLIRTAVDSYRGIDVLVNNAGINKMGAIESLSVQDWDLCADINGKGTFLCTKHAIPHLKSKGSGSIVNLASINSFEGKALRGAFTYSKAGIVNFTKTLAAELGPFGIRVNAVAPGAVLTKEFRHHIAQGTVDTDRLIELTPLRALLEPEDVANAIAFLCSQEARLISGVTLPVDGGWLADGGKGYVTMDL